MGFSKAIKNYGPQYKKEESDMIALVTQQSNRQYTKLKHFGLLELDFHSLDLETLLIYSNQD